MVPAQDNDLDLSGHEYAITLTLIQLFHDANEQKKISFAQSELPLLIRSTCYALKENKTVSYTCNVTKKKISPLTLLYSCCKMKNGTDSEFEDSISIKLTEFIKNANAEELQVYADCLMDSFEHFSFLSCLVLHRVTREIEQ